MKFDLLIIDDDPDYQFFHKLLAVKTGFHHQPKCFCSGKEVIEFLEDHTYTEENFLLFLDLFMVEIDGWGVLDYIESLNQPHRIKVIVVTSSINIADKRKAMRYKSVIEYIEKPLMKHYLLSIKDSPIFSNI